MDNEIPPFDFKPFEYSALSSPSSTRLLSFIQRPEGSTSHSIGGVPLLECLLTTVDLDDNPAYNALSYTWGNPQLVVAGSVDEYAINNKWPISVNGRLLYVTRNLYEALRQLNQPGVTSVKDIDRKLSPFDKTSLIRAAEDGNSTTVISCIKAGASLGSRDVFGETALHYAAENGRLEIVQVLLSYGADHTAIDKSGRNPLECCLQRRRRQHREVAELLSKWGTRGTSQGVLAADLATIERYFWVDALCINQEDIAERNVQVAMMARIYGAAQSVVTWLGIADDTTETAFNALRSIDPAAVGRIGKPLSQSFERDRYSRHNKNLDVDEKPDGIILSRREVRAILDLLQRSYFERVWMVQELALAQAFEIYCGPHHLGGRTFFDLIEGELQGVTDAISAGMPLVKYKTGRLGTGAWSVMDIRLRTRPDGIDPTGMHHQLIQFDNSWKNKLSLPNLLILSWNFASTDPRDKIFSLLNLARPLEDGQKIVTNYGKSVADVFMEAGRILIEAKGDHRLQELPSGKVQDIEPLEGLSYVQAPRGCDRFGCELLHEGWHTPTTRHPDNLPSWVPDFHWPLNTMRLFSTDFKSSGSQVCRIHPSEPGVLRLDGFKFDTIVETDTNPKHSSIGSPLVIVDMQAWLEVVSHLDPVYPTGISRVEAFWRTIAANGTERNENVLRNTFRDFVRNMVPKRWKGENFLHVLRESDPTHLLPSDEEVDKHQSTRKGITTDGFWERYSARRRFMRTQNGYLGLGPRCAKDGDQVWLLAGGRTPFILRPTSKPNQLLFVGEAYVHGIMNGEAAVGFDNAAETIDLV